MARPEPDLGCRSPRLLRLLKPPNSAHRQLIETENSAIGDRINLHFIEDLPYNENDLSKESRYWGSGPQGGLEGEGYIK